MNWWIQLQSICSLIVDSCSSGSLLQGLINMKQSNTSLKHFIKAQINLGFLWCLDFLVRNPSQCLDELLFGLMNWTKWPMVQAISNMAISVNNFLIKFIHDYRTISRKTKQNIVVSLNTGKKQMRRTMTTIVSKSRTSNLNCRDSVQLSYQY